MISLLDPSETPSLSSLRVPGDFYCVLRAPGLLAGMRYPPPRTPWAEIHAIGGRHVVRLTPLVQAYDPSPLATAHAVELAELVGGRWPPDVAVEEARIAEAARIVTRLVSSGQGVVVHCVAGTGRTGTVIGCVLRGLGLPARDVLRYLDGLNRRRGNPGWPESVWQFEVVERFGAPQTPTA
ncbi:MAG TPA: tyrosine-protein phosphatase [Methylomirabilota bacterium]|nr:tyrosine-protein phosphatase [Methylomirabilota bacterium]